MASTPVNSTDLFATGKAKLKRSPISARWDNLDLSQCYAYSDSSSDLPMLSAVGHPWSSILIAALNAMPDNTAGPSYISVNKPGRFARRGLIIASAVGLAAGGVRNRHDGRCAPSQSGPTWRESELTRPTAQQVDPTNPIARHLLRERLLRCSEF